MTDLTFKTKKAAAQVAKIFAERNGEGYCILPQLDGRTLRVSSYRLVSFSDWIKECQEFEAPITVSQYVRR